LVAKKDFQAPKHSEIDVPNLYVIKLMQSLKSRGYVKEDFNWGYFYWFLTNEGIEYLRVYLHLPEDIVPATLKKPKAPATRATGAVGAPTRGERGTGRRERTSFPSSGADEKKLGAPSGDFKPDFRGGFGRGGGGFRREGGGRDSYRRDGQGQGGAAPPTSFGRGAPRT